MRKLTLEFKPNFSEPIITITSDSSESQAALHQLADKIQAGLKDFSFAAKGGDEA